MNVLKNIKQIIVLASNDKIAGENRLKQNYFLSCIYYMPQTDEKQRYFSYGSLQIG